MNAVVTEQGNGLPGEGDVLMCGDGRVWTITSVRSGRIITGRLGQGDRMAVEVEESDTDALDDRYGEGSESYPAGIALRPVLTEMTTDCEVCGEVACERDLRYVETEDEADLLGVSVGGVVCTDCADA